MTVAAIITQIEDYYEKGKKIFVTSSFQTHSIPLLHIVKQANVPVDVLFLDTGYHFPETIAFKNEIADKLELNVIDVRSTRPKSDQLDEHGASLHRSDPDRCCYINKVEPLEPYLEQYDVWINGVRAEQSEQRKRFSIEEEAPFNTIRFHPLLDWSSRQIYQYRREHNLPEHPLEAQGYFSIGCAPCTVRFSAEGNNRMGRWYGLAKTECGLHTQLVGKSE